MRRAGSFYCAVLACIAREGKTSLQITRELGCMQRYVLLALRLMRGRCVYVERYEPVKNTPAVWRSGVHPDAPAPPGRQVYACKPIKGSDRFALVRMFEALMSAPHSQLELEAASGYSHGAVRRVREQLRADKLIRVGAWDRGEHGPYERYWEWAPDKADVQKPKRVTEKESCSRWGKASRQKARDARLTNAICANNGAFSQRA